MKKAVSRIEKAINREEVIAIYGDYDVDGLSATTVLKTALEAVGGNIITFVPDRFEDGYGLSTNGIDKLSSEGASLIITVDTGSLAHEQIDYAKTKKIDVIVTDHHNVGNKLPNALAIINPKRHDSKYPYKELAGVGVAFGLVRALQSTDYGLKQGKEKWLLDLVALGTVCDIVPLTGENRILVYWGLKVMAKTSRPGIRVLAKISDVELDKITTNSLGFRLGPRLNASGRLEHADISLELLTSDSKPIAEKLAQKLDDLNYQRRNEQEKIYMEALEQSRTQTDESVQIFVHPEWSHGVVGVVASKLVEELKKPVFILQQEDDILKGSARSFGGFHLADAIADSDKHLIKGGGHKYAAGVTLKASSLESFRRAINKYYRVQNLQQQELHLVPKTDVKLSDFKGLDNELIELFEKLEPYGESNSQPLLQIDGIKVVNWRPVGHDGKHAKMSLRDKHNNELDAIGFGLGNSMDDSNSIVSITTHIEINNFRNSKTIQLVIKSLTPM
jgi:single-stranded-DNA-specific exonuclease